MYVAPEPNAYPLSSYSYLITPTDQIDPAKGRVLGQFLLYVGARGSRNAPLLGYSPLPKNLVQVVFDAINRINGHPPTPDLNTPQGVADCPNPTFSSGSGPGAAARAGGAAGAGAGAGGNAGPAAALEREQPRAGRRAACSTRRARPKHLSAKERAVRLAPAGAPRPSARCSHVTAAVRPGVAVGRAVPPDHRVRPVAAAPVAKRRLEVRRAT